MEKQNLEVVLASPRGFCGGVKRAIDTVSRTVEKFGAPVYVVHDIVHNEHVLEDFKKKGVVFIDKLEDLPRTDRPVIFSAHGVPDKTLEKAKDLNLTYIDTMCPLVGAIHTFMKRKYEQGYKIILIGNKKHQEIIGDIGQIPEDGLILVENEEDAKNLKVAYEKITYTTQTTLLKTYLENIIKILKENNPQLEMPPIHGVCLATTNRQGAVKALAEKHKDLDVFYSIGGKHSANANKLVTVAKENGVKEAYLIQDYKGLDLEKLKTLKKIGIITAASTPEERLDEVLNLLKEHFDLNVKEEIHSIEKMNFKDPEINYPEK